METNDIFNIQMSSTENEWGKMIFKVHEREQTIFKVREWEKRYYDMHIGDDFRNFWDNFVNT